MNSNFRIDKRNFLHSVWFYIIILFFSFFIIGLLLTNIYIGISIGILLCIIDYFYTSHFWEFNEDGITVAFYYRKKRIEFDKKTIYLEICRNSIKEEPGFKIIIRYKNKPLQKNFLKSFFYYSNPPINELNLIKSFAAKYRIPIKGDWPLI